MLNVEAYYWAAARLQETDCELAESLARAGDLLIEGAAMPNTNSSKERNQNVYNVFEALRYRNALTGRND